MEELYLVYENKGTLTIFRVLPRYIKGQKFSAKIIEENKSRSFAYSMMYGVYSDRESAEQLIAELKGSERTDPRTDDIEAELDKLRPKLEKLESQQRKLEERLEKKNATAERLYEKDELTDTQDEQLSKVETAIDEFVQKGMDASDANDALDEQIDKLEEELYAIEEILYQEKYDFWESKRKECIGKIESMDIEVRPETPKAPQKAEIKQSIPKPELNSKETTEAKGLFGRLWGIFKR